MNWRRAVEQLTIDSYVSHMGITVARTGRNRFMVLKDGVVTFIGGKTYSIGLSVARVLECVTDTPQVYLCTQCAQPRQVMGYCRTCYNRRSAERKRRFRARAKANIVC